MCKGATRGVWKVRTRCIMRRHCPCGLLLAALLFALDTVHRFDVWQEMYLGIKVMAGTVNGVVDGHMGTLAMGYPAEWHVDSCDYEWG